MKRIFCLFFALVTVLAVTSCAANEKRERTVFALDTYCSFSVWGVEESALEKCGALLGEYESLWSVTREESVVAAINRGERCSHSETLALLETAQTVTNESFGAFDVTVAPLVEAYGFYSDDYRVPSDTELSALLPLVDGSNLLGEGSELTLGEGRKIDLGGIAKGRIADLCVAVLKENGATGGVLSFGGNVAAFGTKSDGSLFTVAVTDPRDTSAYLGTLTLTDTSVVTAGGYQRGFTENGVYYHHILDPKTGRPAESGLLSATVLSPDGARADALSTACFVLGKEGALDLWGSAEDFELILVCEDGTIVCTEGLEGKFETNEKSVTFVQKNG
ncbi:MAG: FAD:protein FMN transferase [Clostridia bacterium]|nr:FAD:protein FMN transferase [Clostridia bacterium]